MTRTCITISDFNPNNFNSLLANSQEQPAVRTVSAPLGQVHQLLMNPTAACWQQPIDFAVVWTQPQAVIPSFHRAIRFQEVSEDQILDDVDQFAGQLGELKTRVKAVFVPAWVLPPQERGLGLLDLKEPRGLAYLLMQINLRLAQRLRAQSGIYLLNTSCWTQRAGSQAFNAKLWYMAKVAFGNPVFKHAVSEIKAAIRAIEGNTKKLLVVDLDNTLWGGIVGEVGWQNLTLGGHDPVGEAFVDFQHALKTLQRRGVLLAIVSKNDEAIALEAIDKHPEMVLRRDDFSAWRINWSDKAQNMVDLVAELNLGLQSAVFIDDNPVEQARVAESLAEVFVPKWPSDPLQYRTSLVELTCFDSPTLSEEDLQRAQMYRAERQRSDAKRQIGTLDEWLDTLNTTVRIALLDEGNLPRAAQLLNKTNQMNLSTRRMSESELLAWSRQSGRWVWTFQVSDRFGPQGLTGLLSVQENDTRLKIVDLVLSCRVMGRKIEQTMLAVAVQHASDHGYAGIDIHYLPTKKNRPCLEFLECSGLRSEAQTASFHWESANPYPIPRQIRIEIGDS